MQRFKFNSRVRGEGESIADFVAALRQLSEHCAFGETLQDVLRDRLVCGVKDERIQRRLLGEVELTFARAFQIALAVESANKHAIELQSSVPTTVPPVIKLITGGTVVGTEDCNSIACLFADSTAKAIPVNKCTPLLMTSI